MVDATTAAAAAAAVDAAAVEACYWQPCGGRHAEWVTLVYVQAAWAIWIWLLA